MLQELKIRHKKTQEIMKEKSLDGLMILQLVDLFYYTNSIQVLAAYLPIEGDIIVFFKRSEQKVRKDCPLPIYQTKSLKQIASFVKELGFSPKKLGFEMDVVPVKTYYTVLKGFGQVEPIDASSIIKKVRMIKSDFEISIYKEAGKMVDRVFSNIKNFIKEGMSELDLSCEIEYAFRKESHLGPVRLRGFNYETFVGHVLSGENALIPSALDMTLGGEGMHPAFSIAASHKKIKKNESIIIDFACNYKGYHADTTRTFVIGSLPEKLEKYYYLLKEIYTYFKKNLKPGVLCEEVYFHVVNMIKEANLTDHFMGYKKAQVGFFGHGVGLEVDDFPAIAPKVKTKLEKNMVMAMEPKLFFPGYGAIGIEDNFIITENGGEVITSLNDNYIIV